MNQFEEFSTVFSQIEKDTKELEIKEFDPDAFTMIRMIVIFGAGAGGNSITASSPTVALTRFRLI